MQPVLGLGPAPVLVVVLPIKLVLAMVLLLLVLLEVVLGVTMRTGIMRLQVLEAVLAGKRMMTIAVVTVVIVMIVTHPLPKMRKRN